MTELNWWQQTTIYQIYPISFYDSNGDGWGDLQGIIAKLDYIRQIGFETIWISPFYKSPMQDFGYDISDYLSINPLLGTMDDILELIKEVHQRDMRIVFDMVMNHSSDQHTWFQQSRSSRDHEKRHWYIWRQGRQGKAPNNWRSMVGNSGWHFDEASGEWYYTSFLPFQPDLNYHNPEVKEAMFSIVRHWLTLGVDGFRLDIFNCIIKDASFSDNPWSWRLLPSADNPNAYFQRKIYNMNHEQSFQLARQLREVLDEYKQPQRFLLGEVSGDHHTVKKYLGQGEGLNLIFLFESIDFKFSADYFFQMIAKFEKHYAEPLRPVYVFGNHDQRRYIDKLGNDPAKAKLLALLQFTVRGVPVCYYGEEIGLPETDFAFAKAKDPIARKYWFVPRKLAKWLKLYINRDGCRTPMQWNDQQNAGFSQAAQPWLSVHKQYALINVARQLEDDNSLLHCYRRLLTLRFNSKPLRQGGLLLLEETANVLAYQRKSENDVYLVLANFSGRKVNLKKSYLGKIVFDSASPKPVNVSPLVFLAPWQGVVIAQQGIGENNGED